MLEHWEKITKKKIRMIHNLTSLLKFYCIFFWCFKYAHICAHTKKQIWNHIVQGVHSLETEVKKR